ncbi:hypothetical protein [Spirosoma areae]
MQLLPGAKKSLSCARMQPQQLDRLTDEQLRERKIKAEEMLVVVGLLMASVIGMAIVSELYALALTSIGMYPAADEYLKKRKAITEQLTKRSRS